jgi:hypothetical protein
MKRQSLLDRAESLVTQSVGLVAQAVVEYETDPTRANELLADAKQRVTEARALVERHQRCQRRKWLALQWSAGLLNAGGLVLNLAIGSYWWAALSGVGVVWTATWKMPP